MRGTISRFNRLRGFGTIKPSDGGDELFVHISSLNDGGTLSLVESEELEFEVGRDSKGRAVATNVRRLEPRYRGTVQSFDKGYGKILRDGSEERYFAHYSSVLGDGFKTLEVGEVVEFSVTPAARGPQATRIYRDSRPALLRYAVVHDYDAVIAQLAATAQPEPGKWEYLRTPSKKPLPILRSYILHTFDRIQDEADKLIEISLEDGRRLACFNTGLVTPRQEPLFGVFKGSPTHNPDDPPWVLDGFFRESDRVLTHFPTPPEIANYFTDPTELLYDTRINLVIDVDHIIGDNAERFPPEFRNNEHALRGAFEGAKVAALRRVRRNYKAAIPHFHRGKLQLLLPLCLIAPDRADLALVVARENQVYRASTVLPLDWAYNNARLIARPDTEWLDP